MGEGSEARRPSAGPVALAILAIAVAAPRVALSEQPADPFFKDFPAPIPVTGAAAQPRPAAPAPARDAQTGSPTPTGLLMPMEAPAPGPPLADGQEGQDPAPVAAPPPPVARQNVGGTTRLIENFADQVDVPAGQSVIVRLSRPAERVAIADPEVADVVLVGPKEILINGRGRRHTAQTGETVIQEAQTSLIVWDKQGRADVRGLYVNRSRSEQIELSVTVAELNRTALENEGFDFKIFQNKIFVSGNVSKLANAGLLSTVLTSPIPSGPATITQNDNVSQDRVTFSVLDFNDNFFAFLELLQRESMAKVLARPTLIARSGEPAHFRSGGEVPIPLVTNNQVAVQFKEFGAIVDFTPTFTEDNGVDLKVTAELSQPDTTLSSVSVGGFVVPAFRSRQTSTRVRLHDKQTLLIAGLLRDDEVEDEQKVPYLGDVPGLGVLFRRTSFNHTRSELVILVRPHVQPAGRDDSEARLPTDRGPLTRDEVRTKPSDHVVTRPRIIGTGHQHEGTAPEQPPPGAP